MRTRVLLGCGLALVACKPSEPTPTAGKAASEPAKLVDTAPEPALGTPAKSQPCAEAMAVVERLDALRAADAIDAIAVQDLVRGPALAWLATADLALGRMSQDQPQDVDLITQVLAVLPERDDAGRRSDLALITTQLRAVAFLDMRRQLGDIADERVVGAEAVSLRADAQCLWDGGLQRLASRADALPEHAGEDWASSIALAFEDLDAALGDRLSGPDPGADSQVALARIKAAKQRIEKGMYAVFFRLIVADAEARDRAAASEALGLIDALEDRLADRNQAGLQRMRRQLNGDPSAIDPALIERELAVAFAKRARKYCDKAVLGAEYGTPAAIGETWEGLVYTRVILPDMRARMADQGFDADAYVEDWQQYLAAVESGGADTAVDISPRLVEWNCTYQALLGIAECSASSNELE